MTHVESLRRLTQGYVAENEPMARHTTLGVGGPADLFVEVLGEDELSAVMEYVSRSGLPWTVIGDGSNLLVSDRGIRGLVIKLGGDLSDVRVEGTVVAAGAAAQISAVADIAAEHNLGGLEGVGDVPGSVGGAIVMNAGTHRGYIDAVTRSVSVVTASGERRVIPKEECGFTYRGSRFQHDRSLLIAGAVFDLIPGDGEAIKRRLREIRGHRWEKQPRARSAGCFFKNPPDRSAGRLIEEAGCKGMSQGGAAVSRAHANFIINQNNATAGDLRDLAERVRHKVREEHGVELEYEVRLVGEW